MTRALHADFPPWRTVWGSWAAGSGRDIGKGPRAVATAIDSQSVKSAQTVSKAARGYDAGKKINASDTWSSTPADFPSWSWPPADLHDPAAAERGLFCLRLMRPEITIVWADSAFAGKLVDWAKQHLGLTIKPVSWLEDASGFIMLPRRWVLAVLPG